ncbi:darcynin family protein [Phenylobacterium sp.]|uniref:darcynin family protein n=1 Tax=Phenylobacterium sp. TaxID=1871053 RepID=UPI0025E47D84|nr:darcynin family protein [Phenylobacterium sp.]
MTDAPKITFFMLLRSSPAWLALTREARFAFIEATIKPIFARYPQVALRFYDAEAFSGRATDVAVFETRDLRAYYFLIDALRDTPFLGLPYFEVLEIIPAVEDGYLEYTEAEGLAA